MRPSNKLEGIAISEIRQMNALATASTINLGIGQLPDSAPAEVIAEGIRALKEGNTRYTANAGTVELRKAIAFDHQSRTGIPTTEHSVVVTNGAEGAVWNVMYTYLNPGDRVLIPAIGFSIYETIAKMQGAVVDYYPLGADFGLDVSLVEGCIRPDTKLLVINNPNNPTGACYTAVAMQEVAELLDRHEMLYCLSDEIYKDLYLDGVAVATPSQWSKKVFVVDGISKRGSATGLRIGWTIATPELTAPMIVTNQYITTCASSVSQAAALPILNGECLAYEAAIRENLSKQRDVAYEMLSQIPGVEVSCPGGAFYIFPNISAFGSSKEVAMKLLHEAEVLTIPGSAFGPEGDAYIRISYAVEMALLVEGLTRIQKVLTC